jgi:hypothetical protein
MTGRGSSKGASPRHRLPVALISGFAGTSLGLHAMGFGAGKAAVQARESRGRRSLGS